MSGLESLMNKDLDSLQKIKDNFDWFYLNYTNFKKYYKNQYVAVKDKKFLDNDANLDRLVKRLKICDYSDSIAIEFVYDQKEI